MTLKSIYNSSWFLKSVFALSIFIILFVSGVTYKHMKNLSYSANQVEQTYKVSVELEQIISYLKDTETGQRGFIITQDSIYLEPYLKGRERINNTLAQLRELTKNNEDQRVNLRELNTLIEERLSNFSRTYANLKNSSPNNPRFDAIFLEGKNKMDEIRVRVNTMIALENRRLEERKEAYKKDLKFTPMFLFGLTLLTLILITISYTKIQADIDKLKDANAKLEIFKASANQSEIISKHGNWQWIVEDKEFIFSDNLYRLLGEEPQSFDSTIDNFMQFVHPEDLEKLSIQVEKMMEDQELPFINYRIIRKNGEIRFFKARGKKVNIGDFEKRVLGTTHDITDEVENLLALEEQNFELEQNNKELSAFNYVASHDLQEPLRKIQTFISRLEDKEASKFSDSGKLYLKRISNASSRMRLLIDDLLQFSRTNKSDQVFETINLNDLMENATQDLAEIIQEKNATITLKNLPIANVIPFQIQQLFINLLSNSLKYSKKEVKPLVHVACDVVRASEEEVIKKTKSDFYYKIIFTDNGIGFEQEYAEKIFMLFNRLHNRESYSGTGIGLSICKKIVENHKGFIFANGKPNTGASFTIYLPKK